MQLRPVTGSTVHRDGAAWQFEWAVFVAQWYDLPRDYSRIGRVLTVTLLWDSESSSQVITFATKKLSTSAEGG